MMYEELSRLLAGDLDPASEAALRARIAADPTLARAWADMSALPDLLGGMSFDAPPPALAARLSAQIDEDALDPLEHELDRADPRDSADDTLDPDVTAARHPARARALARAPASASGREAFLDQLLASARTSAPPLVSIAAPIRSPVQSRPVPSRSPAVATPGRGRQVGVTAFIAAMALAAGLVLGLQASDAPLAPAAPAAVAISEGTTTVDGVVDLRAGGVQVRVDGRARVTVAPDGPIAALGASADPDATLPEALIVVPGTAGSTPLAEPGREGGPSIGTDGAPAPVAWQASAGRGDGGLARGGPGAASTPGRFVVTVQVERGSAVIGAEGRSVPVAAGESHTFSPSVIVASHPADNDDSVPPFHGEPVPGLDRADEQESVARRAVTLASELARGADGTPEIDGEDQIAVALESVPGAELLDLDCDSRPCLAVFDYTGDDPAWRDALAYAIAEQLSADVVLTEGQVEVEGETLDLVAVAIDNGKEPRVRRTEDDHRARGALAAIARELTE